MTKEEIVDELNYLTDKYVDCDTWYEVRVSDADESGSGSYSPEEAAQMALDSNAYKIVLMHDDDDEVYDELVLA